MKGCNFPRFQRSSASYKKILSHERISGGEGGIRTLGRAFTRQPLSRRPRSSTLAPPHIQLQAPILNEAEGEGFEHTVGCPTPVFKTGALNHSAIPPQGTYPSPCPPILSYMKSSYKQIERSHPETGCFPSRSPLENDLLIQPIHHKEYGRVYYRSSNQTWHPRNNNKQCRQEKQHDK